MMKVVIHYKQPDSKTWYGITKVEVKDTSIILCSDVETICILPKAKIAGVEIYQSK